MATLATLVAQGTLVNIEVPLPPGALPKRLFYGRYPRFKEWLENELPGEPSDRGGMQSPTEQVDELLYGFLTGEPLEDEYDLRLIKPPEACVWELKTIDVRLFGWFVVRDVFIGVNGVMARTVKDRQMYGAYRNEVCQVRALLDLDEPKWLNGSVASDVLSL